MFISKKKWQEVIGRLDCQQDRIKWLQQDIWRLKNPPKYKVGNHKKFIITQIELKPQTPFYGTHWLYTITMPNGATGQRKEYEITEMLKKK